MSTRISARGGLCLGIALLGACGNKSPADNTNALESSSGGSAGNGAAGSSSGGASGSNSGGSNSGGAAGSDAGTAGSNAGTAGSNAGTAGSNAGTAGSNAGTAGSNAGTAGASGNSTGGAAGNGTGGTAGNAAGGSAGKSGGGAGGSAGKSGGGAGGSAGMSGSAGVSGAGMSGASGAAGSAGAGQTGMGPFPASAPFYQDISQAGLDSQSATILGALNTIGWGDPTERTALGIDFSFNINLADAGVVPRAFTKAAGFYTPDCDTAPVPLPAGGKGEGVNNYACTGGDCHLFVYQGTRLYELYQSNISGGTPTGTTFTAKCLVVWDLTKDYWVPAAPPNFSRGDGCTGADAAGLPMAPLMLTKDDIASGTIQHALRFTIDNNRIAASVYLHPATHLGGPSGGANTLPYGARLRLRGNYDLASLPNANARIVAKALQTYGMYLADGGNIYVSATVDASQLINNSILGALTPNDFEMIDEGAPIDASSQSCKHVPITQ